jgi:TolA-binding protein
MTILELRFRQALCGGLALVAAWAFARGALGETAAEPEASGLTEPLAEQIQADEAAISSQTNVNSLSDETRDLLLQYRQLLSETNNLRGYSRQLEGQVRSQVEEIAFVEQQLVEIENTSRMVMPLMEKMVAALERFVKLDLPFQLEERETRVSALRDALGRADITISEKYRRIIEAYQIETEYGSTLEAYSGEIGEPGKTRAVRFLRLGRVALMYQTPDAAETGYFDAAQKRWVVDDSYRNAVKHGFAVAEKASAPDLLELPIPAPTEARS